MKGSRLLLALLLLSSLGVLANEEIRATPCEKSGMTPLSCAVQANDVRQVRKLLASGVDPSQFDFRGTTALNYAIYMYAFGKESRTPDIIEALLAHPKVKIDEPCQKNGEVPLETAAYAGSAEAVKLLLKHKADPKKVDLTRVDAETRKLFPAPKKTPSALDVDLPEIQDLPKLPEAYFPSEQP